MSAYPGKVLQFRRNLVFHQNAQPHHPLSLVHPHHVLPASGGGGSTQLYPVKAYQWHLVGQWDQQPSTTSSAWTSSSDRSSVGWPRQSSLEELSLTPCPYTLSVGREKAKPKFSFRLVRRLSRLLSPKEERSNQQPYTGADPVDVHSPTRSRSVEGERRGALSRRQILASLQEEQFGQLSQVCQETPRNRTVRAGIGAVMEGNEVLDLSGRFSPEHTEHTILDVQDMQEEWEESFYSRHNSDGESPSDSCSESGSYTGGERFSRCVLIQSISSQKLRTDPSKGDEHDNQLDISNANTSAGLDTADENCNELAVDKFTCDNHKFSQQQHQHQHHTQHKLQTQQQQQRDDVACESEIEQCVQNLSLTDLSFVSTLGIGGFGRVELVTSGQNNNLTFALKKLKKIEIDDRKQQQHILNEKQIMLSCSSPFVVKLYRTFRDTRYLYMLMEPCLGGELWTILRDRKRFDDDAARFYTGCVINAFDYLHDKGIVYRDLKPENLLLDASGYVKLTDFGFAKQLAPGEKSWTFCGTPEYVAPEIITNKSHDHRADIWSVGILMYELLNGIPPFPKRNNSSSQVYTEILKGMKGVHFPTYMSATAVELIRQLCRLSPTQRPSLSVTRRYMWFAGMDWTGLENRTLTPPHLPRITGAQDTSNFDAYSTETNPPQEDFSDWDISF